MKKAAVCSLLALLAAASYADTRIYEWHNSGWFYADVYLTARSGAIYQSGSSYFYAGPSLAFVLLKQEDSSLFSQEW